MSARDLKAERLSDVFETQKLHSEIRPRQREVLKSLIELSPLYPSLTVFLSEVSRISVNFQLKHHSGTHYNRMHQFKQVYSDKSTLPNIVPARAAYFLICFSLQTLPGLVLLYFHVLKHKGFSRPPGLGQCLFGSNMHSQHTTPYVLF